MCVYIFMIIYRFYIFFIILHIYIYISHCTPLFPEAQIALSAVGLAALSSTAFVAPSAGSSRSTTLRGARATKSVGSSSQVRPTREWVEPYMGFPTGWCAHQP